MSKDSSDKSSKKELGMESKITRKDFLGSTLLGMGSALLGAAAPLTKGFSKDNYTIKKNSWSGYGAVGDYADSSGNTREVMESAHKIRDGRYEDLSLIEVSDTGEIYDMVIVGGGLSGLGAAHFFKKNAKSGQKCLILENHPIFGGESKRNEFVVNGQRLMGPQGSNDFGIPTKGSGTLADQIFNELEIPREFEYQNWDSNLKSLKFALDNYAHMTGVVESKVDVGYYFDNLDGSSSSKWINNIWRNDLENAPYPDDIKRELLRWRYHEAKENSEDFQRKLDSMTYKEYLEGELNLPPEVTSYITPVIGLISGASPDAISAFAAGQVGMPGTGRIRGKDTSLPPSFPGGNSVFARYFVKRLIPDAISGGNNFEDVVNQPVNFDSLDKKSNDVAIRLKSTVVRIEHEKKSSNSDYVHVTYEKDDKVYRIKARSVVMASGGWVNKHIIKDLPKEIKEAYEEFNYAPALVTNVALTNWRFLYNMGITAARWFSDGYGFSCNIRRSMTIGDNYNPPLHPDEPTVLTFYMGAYTPGLTLQKQTINARWKIFGTSFSDYERQLRKQMVEQFGPAGFNPKEDIAGIILNRWGHARLVQQPGWYFGENNKPAPREVVSNGFGRIAIGHSELNGHQNWTGAIRQGYRAAEQSLSRI